jgi:hypothetical protein
VLISAKYYGSINFSKYRHGIYSAPVIFRTITIRGFLIIPLVLVLLSVRGYAQKQHSFHAPNLMIETRANYGILIAHHLEMEIYNRHLSSFEICIARSTYGKQQWESMYNYPVTGLAYWNAWLGDPQTLGHAHALMPYIDFPIIKNETTEFNFRLAAGVGYLTKHFDRLENYKYIAIGSHLNAAINLMAEYRWKPINHLQVFGGIQLMHFSNGSTKTPNFGLNIPSLSGGVAFRINKENPYIRRAIRPSLTMFEFDGRKFLEVRVNGSFGFKDIGEALSERYYVMAGTVSVLKSVSYKGKAGLSLDLSYDGSDGRYVGIKGVDYKNNFQLIKPGISLMYEVVLSRMSFPLALGFYTGGKYKSEGMSYYKLGIQYVIIKNMFANITLKTHYARADYVALGIGYRFKVKQYFL